MAHGGISVLPSPLIKIGKVLAWLEVKSVIFLRLTIALSFSSTLGFLLTSGKVDVKFLEIIPRIDFSAHLLDFVLK